MARASAALMYLRQVDEIEEASGDGERCDEKGLDVPAEPASAAAPAEALDFILGRFWLSRLYCEGRLSNNVKSRQDN